MMQQLRIQPKDKLQHLEFFNHIVVCRIKRELKWPTAGIATRNMILEHDILEYCINHANQLAIGEPVILRGIIDDFSNYGYAAYIASQNEFRDVLARIFSYKEFCENSFGTNIVNHVKWKEELRLNCKIGRYAAICSVLISSLRTYDADVAKHVETRLNRSVHVTKDELVEAIDSARQSLVRKKELNDEYFWANWNPYTWLRHQDIRTCPYCNRQYIAFAKNTRKKVRADIDHFWPKAKYPYLSMSLYNFIPSCKFCNTSLKREENFRSGTLSPYEFSIDEYVEFTYKPGANSELSIEPRRADGWKYVKDYEEMFIWKDIYQTHTNLAKEYWEQSLRYSQTWIEDILKGFPNEINEEELLRLVVGKIPSERHLLDEPLGKLKRDLVRQIWGEEVLEVVEE